VPAVTLLLVTVEPVALNSRHRLFDSTSVPRGPSHSIVSTTAPAVFTAVNGRSGSVLIAAAKLSP